MPSVGPVGAAPAGDPIVVMRGSDPRLLARDGLVGLGFSPAEAEQLLDGAPGDTPALRATSRTDSASTPFSSISAIAASSSASTRLPW